METIKKFFSKLTNGVIIIIIAGMHTKYALSADGFGRQFAKIAKTGFFKICNGAEGLPLAPGELLLFR